MAFPAALLLLLGAARAADSSPRSVAPHEGTVVTASLEARQMLGAGWANLDGATPTLIDVIISDDLELTTGTQGAGFYEEGDGAVAPSYRTLRGHIQLVSGMADPTGVDAIWPPIRASWT